jgi:hypothetical protein
MKLLSPNSMYEKIKYILLIGGTNSKPNLASHRHPQVKLIARVSVAGVSPARHQV